MIKSNKTINTVRISSGHIYKLEPNEVFVFGSNLRGIHGAGAAFTAMKFFGAEYGIGEGVTGDCYAIPTKDEDIYTLSIEKIGEYIKDFIEHAKDTPDKDFLVVEIGCGLANYYPSQIAPLFKEALSVENIYLPKSFIKILL
jgi:hypothetical protein